MDEYVVNDYHGANDPPKSQACKVKILITPENADQRIREACDILLRSWEEWNGLAMADAQREQTDEAWFDSMRDQVGAVLTGMVSDEVFEPVLE